MESNPAIEPAPHGSPRMDAASCALLEHALARYTGAKYHRAAWQAYGLEPDGFSQKTWQEIAGMGWLALGLPEAMGGAGGALGDLLPLFFAAGAGLWREPLLPVLGETCGVLLGVPQSEIRDGLLTGILSGEQRPAFMDPGSSPTIAVRPHPSQRNQYIASGSAEFVVAAQTATTLIFPGRLQGQGTSDLFSVSRTDPEVTLNVFPTIDARVAATVVLKSAPATLIALGDGLMTAHRRRTVLAAAETVGIQRAVIAATAQHLKGRKQFGRPLSEFQVLQHRLVDMTIREAESTALLWNVVEAHQESAADLDRRLLQLRVVTARAAREVAAQGIQLHGAMGMTEELGIGDYYKRMLLLNHQYLQPDAALDAITAAQEL